MPEPIISPGASRARRSVLETPPPPPRLRPRRSRLLLIGLPMLAVFAAFAAIIWMAYEDGAYGPPVGEPPLIAAAATPLKLAPGDPGGRVVASQGEVRELIGDEASPAAPERLLPPPEQPLTPLSATGVADAADEGDPVTAANGALGSAQPLPTAPTGAAPSALAGLAEDEGDPPQAATAGEPPQAEAALQALIEQVSRPSPADAPPAPSPSPGAAPQEARPAIAAPAPQPAPQPAPEPATPAPSRTESTIAAIAPGQPVTGTAQAPAPAPQPAPQATQTAATEAVADRYRVQLAAVREEADARRAWDLFMIDLGPVLTRLQPYFERAETTNGVFYRVQAGPFATLDSAESVCTELKQRNASCFVVRR